MKYAHCYRSIWIESSLDVNCFYFLNAQNFLTPYSLMMYLRSQYEKIDQDNLTTVSFFWFRLSKLNEDFHIDNSFHHILGNNSNTEKLIWVQIWRTCDWFFIIWKWDQGAGCFFKRILGSFWVLVRSPEVTGK